MEQILIKNKKNDFKLFDDLTHSGFMIGQKKYGYWGVKYNKAITDIFEIIHSKLSPKLKTDYYKNKDYKTITPLCNALYELIVDFHLDQKKIKGHNSVYADIQYEYPKKKWLMINDNK